jgi:hypothetical protein
MLARISGGYRSKTGSLIRIGVVPLGLTGHRTRSVFDRYHIVSEEDLAQASERLFGHLAEQAEAAKIVPLKKVS